MSSQPLVNRVAQSSLVTINLEDYFPQEPIVELDISEYLFQGLILREKDFRLAMKDHDWSQYQDVNLTVHCSADAIIPTWAYMLIATLAQPFASFVFCGTQKEYITAHYLRILEKSIDIDALHDKRIVIKGCSNKPVPASAYVELARLLRPMAKNIMYGEPCSTVPIFKKPRQ